MKKVMEKLLAMTSGVALMAVITAAGIPSLSGLNQPAEPANLNEVIKNHRG